MTAGKVRIGIVGAASLAGKELSDALAESSLAASVVVLLDDEAVAGRMTAAGDEAAFIQKVDAESFHGLDFVFFAGEPAMTERYWKDARDAGASIVDMTYALEGEPEVMVRAPWALGLQAPGAASVAAQKMGLTTPAVVSAHPAALMVGLVASRLGAKLRARVLAATVFEPASEHGQAAMDELHQQTVSLLSFQTLPRAEYDAQIAFNLLPSLGDAARVKLAEVKRKIERHYAALGAGEAPELLLQLVQAPVFHGYVANLMVELEEEATVAQVELAIFGDPVEVVTETSDPPSNISAAGQGAMLVRVDRAGTSSRRFWLWLAADNLKLAALNAIACANELGRMRPQGKVQ